MLLTWLLERNAAAALGLVVSKLLNPDDEYHQEGCSDQQVKTDHRGFSSMDSVAERSA